MCPSDGIAHSSSLSGIGLLAWRARPSHETGRSGDMPTLQLWQWNVILLAANYVKSHKVRHNFCVHDIGTGNKLA